MAEQGEGTGQRWDWGWEQKESDGWRMKGETPGRYNHRYFHSNKANLGKKNR